MNKLYNHHSWKIKARAKRAELPRTKHVRPRTFKKWNDLGFRVKPGSKCVGHDFFRRPLFAISQVWDVLQKYSGENEDERDVLLGTAHLSHGS